MTIVRTPSRRRSGSRADRRRLQPFAPLALLLGLVALLAAPDRAQAQPGDGVPKPISAREINDFAERLGLTPMQRAAIDPVHDAYKVEFARLHAQLIEPFLEEQRRLNRGGAGVTREAVDDLLGAQERILTRVAGVDARFFDQIAPMLDGDQAARLPRVRLARDRIRASTNSMMMAFGGSPPDLSAVFTRVDDDLDAETIMRADEILAPYERRLTRRVIALDEGARNMMRRMVDAMESAGILGMSQEDMMADPQLMQQAMTVVQEAFLSSGAEAREEAAAIAELNMDTYRRLVQAIPTPSGMRLRTGYMQAAALYGMTLDAPEGPASVWLLAEQIEDLDDATRAAVRAGLDAAFAGENQMIERGLEAYAEMQANADPTSFDQQGWQELQEMGNEMRETFATRREAAAAQIASLLGEDWETRALASGGPASLGGAAAPATAVGVGIGVAAAESVEVSAPVVADRATMDRMLPQRISLRDLERAADRAGVPEEMRSIIEVMHQDYVEAYGALPAFDRLQEINEELAATWSDEEAASSRVDIVRRLNAARRSAMDEITAHEERFFDDVVLTFGETDERTERLEQERRARGLQRLLGRGGMRGWTMRGGSSSGDVDLLDLVRSTDLSSDDRAAALTAIDGRIGAMTEVATRLFAARLELEIGQAAWQVALNDVTGENPMEYQRVYQEAMGDRTERLESIRSEFAALNTANLGDLETALSVDGWMALRQDWRMAAHPRVYGDPMYVVPQYERALSLDDLEPGQRTELEGTLAGYRSEWERLCSEIVTRLESRSVDFGAWQEVDWAAVQVLEQELQQLGFDRSEQNIRAANRLRLVLTEEQLARVGGLPATDDEVIPSIWAF